MIFRTTAFATCTAAFAALGSAAAYAANNGHIQTIGQPVYVSPMITANFANGKDQRTEDGMGVSLAVGRRLNELLTVEGEAYLSRHKASIVELTGADQHILGVGANVLLWPFDEKLSNLYGIVGAHYTDFSDAPVDGEVPSTVNTKGFSVDAGAGALMGIGMFGKPAALRLEARYRFQSTDKEVGDGKDSFNNLIVGLGILVPLFWTEPPPAAAPEQAVEVTAPVDSGTDSDNDGLIDSMDKCPDTPAGSQVDPDGCPQAPAAP